MSLESGQRKWRLITNTISSNVSKRCKYVTFFLFSISFQNWNPSCYVHSSFKFSKTIIGWGLMTQASIIWAFADFRFMGTLKWYSIIFCSALFCSHSFLVTLHFSFLLFVFVNSLFYLKLMRKSFVNRCSWVGNQCIWQMSRVEKVKVVKCCISFNAKFHALVDFGFYYWASCLIQFVK